MIRTGRMYFMKDGKMESATHVYGLYNGEVRKMKIYVDDGKEGPSRIEDLQYMQDWAGLDTSIKTAIRDAMVEEQVYALTDRRDSTVYNIAKLKDGNIWMCDNLRLQDYNCTTEDTDIESGTFQVPTDTSSGWGDNTEVRVHTDNTYGAYYTWPAATAGTWSSLVANEAPGSIAPKGWKLPSKSDFEALFTKYNPASELFKDPAPKFLGGGYFWLDHYENRTPGTAQYWSSTGYDQSNAYATMVYITEYGSSASTTRYGMGDGCAIRCIARI